MTVPKSFDELEKIFEEAEKPFKNQEPKKDEEDQATEDELIEALADMEHVRWSKWQKIVHSMCEMDDRGRKFIPESKFTEWDHMAGLSFRNLPERVKEHRRAEARNTIAILQRLLWL